MEQCYEPNILARYGKDKKDIRNIEHGEFNSVIYINFEDFSRIEIHPELNTTKKCIKGDVSIKYFKPVSFK